MVVGPRNLEARRVLFVATFEVGFFLTALKDHCRSVRVDEALGLASIFLSFVQGVGTPGWVLVSGVCCKQLKKTTSSSSFLVLSRIVSLMFVLCHAGLFFGTRLCNPVTHQQHASIMTASEQILQHTGRRTVRGHVCDEGFVRIVAITFEEKIWEPLANSCTSKSGRAVLASTEDWLVDDKNGEMTELREHVRELVQLGLWTAQECELKPEIGGLTRLFGKETP